jgi:hypothetical protein
MRKVIAKTIFAVSGKAIETFSKLPLSVQLCVVALSIIGIGIPILLNRRKPPRK